MAHNVSDVEFANLLLEFLGLNLSEVKKILNNVDQHVTLAVLNLDSSFNLLSYSSQGVLHLSNCLTLFQNLLHFFKQVLLQLVHGHY